MRTLTARFLDTVTVFTVAAAVFTPAASAQHSDTKLGFKFEPPSGWSQVPVSVEGGWVAAKYQADKEDYFENLATYDSSTALLTVMAFTPEGAEKPPQAAFTNPHATYAAYLKSQVTPSPLYVTEKKEVSNGGVKVHVYEYTFTERADLQGRPATSPRRAVAWIHHFPDIDVVAQFVLLESAHKKRQAELESCLKSFRAAAKSAKPSEAQSQSAAVTLDDLWKLTPEERKIRRTAAANAAYDRVKSSAPDGWQVSVNGRFFVVNHADTKFEMKVVGLGGAIMDYLDKTFDYVGKGEFVRKPILRICADSREHAALKSDGQWWGGTNLEIVTYKDESDGAASSAFQEFSQAVFRHWFHERDIDFAMAAPDWFSMGMLKAFRAAQFKEGQLMFAFDEFEYMNARVSYRDKQHVTLRQLFTPPLDGGSPPQPTPAQAACAARFFLAGMGFKETKYREMFKSFVKNYRSAITDVRKKGISATSGTGIQDFNNRAEFWKVKKSFLLSKAAELTFVKWKDEDWKALEFAYLTYLSVNK